MKHVVNVSFVQFMRCVNVSLTQFYSATEHKVYREERKKIKKGKKVCREGKKICKSVNKVRKKKKDLKNLYSAKEINRQ